MAKKIKKKSLVKHSVGSLKKNKSYKHSEFKTQRKGKAKEKQEDAGSDFEVVLDQDKRLTSRQSYEASEDEEDDDKEYLDTRQLVAKQNRKKKKSGGFQSMGLSNNVFKGIIRKGYKIPTPIQRKTIPVILDGKDVVAMARTGSGKTAAFLIPMFERLKAHSAKSGARVLIMSPTRELALQTLKFSKELGRFTGLRAAVVLGGDRMEDQFAALHENPDIIIATPGRFLHVVMEMDLKLKSVEYVVFDEADRLFEMGFQEQLTEILYRLPESRQTLLFSATLPRLLVDFAKAGLQDPTLIRLDVDTKLSDQLKSSFFHCRGEDKVTILLHLLLQVIPSSEQTVIFAATKHHVEYLQLILQKAEISSTYIYSSLDQAARKINLAKFQHKRAMVMIVTDLAARGIDIPLLDNVINFHFPAKPKLFLHRVGRVARAGRCGTAYSLISQNEVAYLLDLHLFLGRPLKPVAPDQQDVKDSDGLYGGVPQSVVDDMEGKLRIWMAESSELQTMQKVCENAMKQYLKSRPASALESIKRAKQMDKTGAHLGVHPIFRNFDNEDEVERLKLLNSLKSYKGSTTIFEINSTSKTNAMSVMKQKRSFHGNVIQRKFQKKEEMQQQQTPEDPSCRPSQSVSLADEELIHSVFHNMIGLKRPQSDTFNPRPRKKQKLVPVRDEENYLHYRPKDYKSEQGLQLTRSFDQEVSGAVMDITGDEEESLRQRSKVIRWDRKKKKFMRGGGNDLDRKNKIRTESGAWIAASYKSKIYKEWIEKNKIASQEDDDDVPQGKQSNQSQADRFMVLGIKQRKWHTKGMEKGSNDGQKNKFKRELKRPEQIMKERRIKQRKQSSQKSREHVKAKRRSMKAQRTKK